MLTKAADLAVGPDTLSMVNQKAMMQLNANEKLKEP
jgi:hypothetical protein